ncbi:hypothetical protein PoB_002979200 [Plakobranchus ocellatus]|uniref:RRM domain-containing protein n=1 Tax=Plakobranchus ocellatus TaxID=259542 RepID=A0AAV4A8L2_9GAST|nr:hypothetical protein PoB_002979200 [Plakobranchus ocellatus]
MTSIFFDLVPSPAILELLLLVCPCLFFLTLITTLCIFLSPIVFSSGKVSCPSPFMSLKAPKISEALPTDPGAPPPKSTGNAATLVIHTDDRNGRRSRDIQRLTDRLGWSATQRDMVQDLIRSRVSIGMEAHYLLDYAKSEQRGSAIKRLANLPFHTIMVRWKLSFHFPVYTPPIVYGILSRFGKIESMGSLSANSAFVVFDYEYHACRAISKGMVGFSYCPLICSWWYLERYWFPINNADDVKREDLLLSDNRLERNSKRHIAQIKSEFKRKAAALSYNVATFRP